MGRNPRKIHRALWVLPLIATVAVAIAAWHWSGHDAPSGPPSADARTALPLTAEWVDESTCQACHRKQVEDWRGSHHHLAMQEANSATVLGDFDDVLLRSDAETSLFFHSGRSRNGSFQDGTDEADDGEDVRFWINTPGSDGQAADFPVAYTFGVDPLQQYLLQLPDGRLQAHGAAWDVPEQRWFHLYDGEGVDHRHRLHWSRAQQNADFMCIECHTTGFQRGYDAEEEHYASSWKALGVGCQSCHGPASEHLRWAEEPTRELEGEKGFIHSLAASNDSLEVQTCAHCHSRRTPLGNGSPHGGELLDHYLPMILRADLYEVDGKIQDEVFEYGSFLQSRMYAAGVLCSDCHDPHSAELRAAGDAICTQCHNAASAAVREGIDTSAFLAKRYDHPSHHHHPQGSPGSQCINCHMPGKLYMGNDLRHDHSFSSPHPRQAMELSHSDACLDCHGNGEAREVLAGFARWYPEAQPRDQGYARDLHAARQGKPGAAAGLLRQLARDDLPNIRRASLLSELPNYPSIAAQRVLVEASAHPSALVRHSAVQILGSLLPAPRQAELLTALLEDPVRAVRLAASWELLQLLFGSEVSPRLLRQLIAEYEQVQNSMLERAESQLNLASIYQMTGRGEQVEPALRRALRQDSSYHPARITLAQWMEQALADPGAAFELLQEGIAQHPEEASLQHALGLMHVRLGHREQTLAALRRAARLAPDQPDYGYVLAVALHDSGKAGEALQLLQHTLERHPAHRQSRQAMVAYLRAAGRQAEADAALEVQAALNPEDPLLHQLEQASSNH